MKTTIPIKDSRGLLTQTQEIDIEEGGRVFLQWNGFGAMPKYLDGSWATILRFTPRGNIVVAPDLRDGELTIYHGQIRKYKPPAK